MIALSPANHNDYLSGLKERRKEGRKEERKEGKKERKEGRKEK